MCVQLMMHDKVYNLGFMGSLGILSYFTARATLYMVFGSCCALHMMCNIYGFVIARVYAQFFLFSYLSLDHSLLQCRFVNNKIAFGILVLSTVMLTELCDHIPQESAFDRNLYYLFDLSSHSCLLHPLACIEVETRLFCMF